MLENLIRLLVRQYDHFRLGADHALLPIHLMVIAHWYGAASLLAGIVLALYAAATICHERC